MVMYMAVEAMHMDMGILARDLLNLDIMVMDIGVVRDMVMDMVRGRQILRQ